MKGRKNIALQTKEGIGNEPSEPMTEQEREKDEEITRTHKERMKRKNDDFEKYLKAINEYYR